MFGKSINLVKVMGFQIKVDVSWIIIAVLVTWSLAVGFFPHYIEGLRTMDYWILAVFGALGLFFSIVFHEFWHSYVARKMGVSIKGITLFVFGGVAEMEDDPKTPRSEFWIAIAGPLASFFLALVFYLVFDLARSMEMAPGIISVFMYLALINLILAIFNLIPAFPMDGGRILRAALWHLKKDLPWATRTAANMGSIFGLVLIGLGLLNMLTGNLVGGLWYFVIGMFIRFVAQNSYRQLMVKRALAGETVQSLMKEPVYVPGEITLQELVEDYVYRYHFKMFPVRDGKTLTGCITTRQVGEIERQNWPGILVREITRQCSMENTVGPDEDVVKVLGKMNRTGLSRMMVVRNGELLGIISLKDIMAYLSARMELEGDGSFSD
ncbi:site-2 protease family protein [Desulfonatronovibrio hydrogenovorans]|uniref:site-2 protease family protein n=1 Tax=Desulfonatronovibrio hydrogenovorans TaxID=53245 RepID=UPI00048D001D|nr:site-2 protease family protein [Desulfonatronovibrio hydrogenovorans]